MPCLFVYNCLFGVYLGVSLCMGVCQCVALGLCLCVCMCVHVWVCLCVCLRLCLSVCLFGVCVFERGAPKEPQKQNTIPNVFLVLLLFKAGCELLYILLLFQMSVIWLPIGMNQKLLLNYLTFFLNDELLW